MNNYHSLKVYGFNHHERNARSKEWAKRFYSYATIHTNLKVMPGTTTFNLFLMPIPSILLLCDHIKNLSTDITILAHHLPRVAQDQFFFHSLRDEIMSTNEIEGVKTTSKEVNKAIDKVHHKTPGKESRLQSFTKMYFKIQTGNVPSIKSPKDIRHIYDYLLKGEIAPNKLPDGKYFRNRYVRIGNDFKTVHTPKEHESEFMPDILDWIDFINNDNIPLLFKTFIAHYYFECIHPFNDGNGRTGRYLVCVYLGQKLDKYTAVSFSHEVNKHKNKYYKAFQALDDPRNYGEITFFVKDMLEILFKSQMEIVETLTDKLEILRVVKKQLKTMHITFLDKSILYILFQAAFFNDINLGIKDNDMDIILSKFHKTSIKRSLNNLTKRGLVAVMKKRPIIRCIDPRYFKKLLLPIINK